MQARVVWGLVLLLAGLPEVPTGHGVLHEALIDGITFQEWGGGSHAGASLGNGAGGGEGGGGAELVLLMEPAWLDFGPVLLGEPHARRVSVANLGNATLHLASVSGATSDFHASFFDSKTLPPGANTSFSVVFLGRGAGPARADLYLHSSLGARRYEVCAAGRHSPYRAPPLLPPVGPLLIYNPGPRPLQVLELYSSARWLELAPPSPSARSTAWLVQPHETLELAALVARAPPARAQAYVRVKLRDRPSLLLRVEAWDGALRVEPPAAKVLLRGTGDRPDTLPVRVSNAGPATVTLSSRVEVRCDEGAHSASAGVELRLNVTAVGPHAPLATVGLLSLDWARLGAGLTGSGRRSCTVDLLLDDRPASLHALVSPGTLALHPPEINVVSTDREAASRDYEVWGTNEFPFPLLVARVLVPDELERAFLVRSLAPRVLRPGERSLLVALTARRWPPPTRLAAALELHTNASVYRARVFLHTGRLDLRWEWPVPDAPEDGSLDAGLLPMSATRRVRGALRNPGPAALCITSISTDLEGAAVQFLPCVQRPDDPDCWCIHGGESGGVSLTLVAPARAGTLRGSVTALTQYGSTVGRVVLRAAAGRISARPVELQHCAPGVWCHADLLLDSELPPANLRAVLPHPPCSALQHEPDGEPVITTGNAVRAGRLRFAPELLCAPRCYTGLAAGSPEEAEWAARALMPHQDAMRVDAEELQARRALFSASPQLLNYSVLLHTDLAVMVPVTVTARLEWPRLVPAATDAGLVGLGGFKQLDVRITNPSGSHALLLQPLLSSTHTEGDDERVAERDAAAFKLRGWDAPEGGVRFRDDLLELDPHAHILLHIEFHPMAAISHRAPLFLRNNLTLLEIVSLTGTGTVPSIKLDERRPGSPLPVQFDTLGPGCRLTAKRELSARNTGLVNITVRGLTVSGAPCEGYGFKVEECEPFSLEPNETRTVKLAFTADLTLGRVSRTLRLELAPGQPADFRLEGTVKPDLAAACLGSQPRPPWERSLRRAFFAVSLLVLVGALCAAMLDSDRLLQRTLGRRTRPPPAPLDLRSLNRLTPSLSPPRQPEAVPPPVPLATRGVRRRLARRPHESPPEEPREPSPPPPDRPPCPPVQRTAPAQPVPVRPAPPPPQPAPSLPDPPDDDSSTTTDSSAGDDRDKEAVPSDVDSVSVVSRREEAEVRGPGAGTADRCGARRDTRLAARVGQVTVTPVKRERPVKRRSERAAPPAPTGHAGLRWGATFSSVVARSDPPAPIARPPPAPAASLHSAPGPSPSLCVSPQHPAPAVLAPAADSNSLFYFNRATDENAGWPGWAGAWPPEPAPVSLHEVRAYDPFSYHSLTSIWAPTAAGAPTGWTRPPSPPGWSGPPSPPATSPSSRTSVPHPQ